MFSTEAPNVEITGLRGFSRRSGGLQGYATFAPLTIRTESPSLGPFMSRLGKWVGVILVSEFLVRRRPTEAGFQKIIIGLSPCRLRWHFCQLSQDKCSLLRNGV